MSNVIHNIDKFQFQLYFNLIIFIVHIPTFVNFLREIESCNEIEDYVINYLGDSKQAKDFAHQFYINRESQVSQSSVFLNVHYSTIIIFTISRLNTKKIRLMIIAIQTMTTIHIFQIMALNFRNKNKKNVPKVNV
jgi:hypothetical protein